MMQCVDCGFMENKFDLKVSGIDSGSFIYVAKCPTCGSTKVKHLPGTKESDLTICDSRMANLEVVMEVYTEAVKAFLGYRLDELFYVSDQSENGGQRYKD